MQLSTTLDLFLMERESKGRSPKTLLDYKKSVTRIFSDIGITDISELNKLTVIQWAKSRSDEGMKPVTINKYLRDLRAFVNFLIENELIKPFKISLVKAQESPIRYYTDDEISKLIEPLELESFPMYRTQMMIAVALATGARVGTICALQVDDIDYSGKSITFREQKNKLAAVLPLTSKLAILIHRYKTLTGISEGFLFPESTGGRLSVEGAHTALRRLCERHGVETADWHNFRRSFARNWVLQGGDIFRLSSMLGHSDIAVTRRYARIYGTDLQGTEAFTVLDKVCTTKTKRIKLNHI